MQVLWSVADAPPAADQLLTDPERQRLHALVRSSDQAGFLSAHLLARIVVARVMDVDPAAVGLLQRCSRCGGPHGPPVARVAGHDAPWVSLSRSGRIVAAAAAYAPIGVDHEPRGAAHGAVAEVALTPRERAHLVRLPTTEQPDALLRWWVRKEALLKMTGLGLAVDPSLIEVSAPDEPPSLLAWDGPGPRPCAELADLDLDGAVGAVAVQTEDSLRVHVERRSLSPPGW